MVERKITPMAYEQALEVSRRFRALADPTRIQILSILKSHSNQVTIDEIAAAIGISATITSHHLRVLRDSGLVGYTRDKSDERKVAYFVEVEQMIQTHSAVWQLLPKGTKVIL